MTRKSSSAALAASSAFQQPAQTIGTLHPGDRVRFRGGDCEFVVIDSDGALVRLRSEAGAELRAGWRVLERCT